MSVIECFAAVAWEVNGPLTIEKVEVCPPAAGEVRVKLTSASICMSDIGAWTGHIPSHSSAFPLVLGHEGAGVVESVGEGVDEFKVGDKVVPCGLPWCGDCYACKHKRGVQCESFSSCRYLEKENIRISTKGQKLHPLFGLGTFCEYIVVHVSQLGKVSPETCLESLSPLGCAVLTGWGAAEAVAGVKQADKVAVWGAGAVGLSVIMASVNAKAEIIIAVDIDADKLETAVKFGATHTLLADVDTPHKIIQICGSGVDFAFECSGSPKAREQVIHSIQTGWGVAVMIGLSPQSAVISIPPNIIIGQGKTIRGTVFGGWKNPKEALTKLADSFTKNSIPDVKGLVSSEIKLEDVGSALQTLIKPNKHCRILIKF